MLRTLVITAVLAAALVMFSAVTPWLINQKSTWTFLLVPFAWIGFIYAAMAVFRRIFKGKVTK